MSVVSNIMITFPCGEDWPARTAEVNAWRGFTSHHFRLLNDTPDAYGGSKCLESAVLIGAFNYFGDFDAFLKHCRECVNWRDPQWVRVHYKEQYAFCFELLTLDGTVAGVAERD